MLETVRAYAAAELTEAGERDEAMEGLVRYCIGEAVAAADGLVGPGQVDWLDRVRTDLETYRSALTWLIERGRHAEAAGIACALKFFWLIRGHAPEGLRWYEQILNVSSLPITAESRALVGAALMCYTQGDLGRVRATIERALALARTTGDIALVAEAQMLLGHVEHVTGHLPAARDLFAQSVEGFRVLSIPWGTGLALSHMAEVALATGDAGQAERLLDEAAPVLPEAGPWFLSLGAYVRAVLAVRRGNPDQAIALVRESLTRIRELHDKLAFVYVLVPMAAAAVLKGDDAWAARIVGARDAVLERTGVTLVEASVQDLRRQAERDALARLGPDRWALAYAAGRITSIDALLQDIDDVIRQG